MERVVNIARSHEEADRWDREQARAMTPDERRTVAATLRLRVYGPNCPDVRETREVHVGFRKL